MESENQKALVEKFWENDACGERLYLDKIDKESFLNHEKIRYELEPYIINFAKFSECEGKTILEIGVGLGADHRQFAESGAICTGIDLTHKAIEITKKETQCL